MTHINQRRDTAANWATANPVLQLGEVGWETDTRKSKLGNGTTAWNSLPYTTPAASIVAFTPAGSVAANDVQEAIEELDTEKSPVGHTHAATAITYAGSAGLSATDVEGALDELDTEKSEVGHTHAATAITYAGSAGISATDVEGALDELDTEKSAVGHTHAATAITYAGSAGLSATDVEGALDELDTEKSSTSHTHVGILPVFSVPGDLTVQAYTIRLYVEQSGTIQSVRASVGTAPTGASILVDVNKNGTTIFTTQSNRPTIAASTNTDVSGTPDVTSLSAGDYLTIDVDQVGSTVAGSDLTVQVVMV